MLFVKTWKPAKPLLVEKIVFTRRLGHGWCCGRIVAVSGFSVAGKTDRRYTNLSAKEVRQVLLDRSYSKHEVPSEHTDAIFENVKAVRAEAKADPKTLEVSVDTKTKVKLGEYSQGGNASTDRNGNVVKGLDRDPPAKNKLVPLGVLILDRISHQM